MFYFEDVCPNNLEEVTDDLITLRDKEPPYNEFDRTNVDQPFGVTTSNQFEIVVDVPRIDVYTLVITTKQRVPGDIVVTIQTEEMGEVTTTAIYKVQSFDHEMSDNYVAFLHNCWKIY